MSEPGKLIWVDLETTGLSADKDVILEIALVVTDELLNILDDGKLNFVLNPVLDDKLFALEKMDPFVKNMHTENGLLSFLPRGMNLEVAETGCMKFVAQHFPDPKNKSPLCGSSVHFDRAFLKKHMPKLESMFAYRNIDVLTLKELAQRWSPEVFEERPLGAKTHRAMPYIFDSIAELAHYRDEMML